MIKFNQPQNRENDLKAILEGYELVLSKSKNWFAEALQKDGIQNSWAQKSAKRVMIGNLTYAISLQKMITPNL